MEVPIENQFADYVNNRAVHFILDVDTVNYDDYDDPCIVDSLNVIAKFYVSRDNIYTAVQFVVSKSAANQVNAIDDVYYHRFTIAYVIDLTVFLNLNYVDA